tara:strand:+ start:956 stop:1705 length:750 start_codon:yes stop_codon:yes gene_type:complete
MSSSYSTRLGYELINPGEQSNAWGTSTNNTLSNSVEESIAGVYTLNLASAGATYTLTSTDGGGAASTNEQRQFAINCIGATGNKIIQCVATEKMFFVINGSNQYTITMRLGAAGATHIIQPLRKVLLAAGNTAAGASGVANVWFDFDQTQSVWRQVTTATATAYAGDKIMVNTSVQACTITLPASPVLGDEISFLDEAGNFATNALTLNAGGTIQIFGATANGTVNTNNAAFTIVYTGATATGWKLTGK